jgi:flagellar hook-associated protein 3 FlgL
MELRITPQVIVANGVANARQQYDQLAVLQQEASTGKRILQPSDDPPGALQVLSNQAQYDRLGVYHQNIADAQAKLNDSVSTLTQVSQLLAQAKQLALQGSNSTNTPGALQALGAQADSILKGVLGLANTQQSGQYLYGGTSSQAAPFSVNAQGQVVYNGSAQTASQPIGLGQQVQTLYAGSQVFQSLQRGPTVITGTTGATAGSGTDSATGEGTLTVAHTSTVYAPGSGVQPGTNSTSGDTILGPSGAHTLKIDDTSGTGAGGTVQLDNGPLVNFTNTDTNLQVQGTNGQTVFLNTTAITAGFNGSVSITANGTLSVDGGASTTPINFSGDQVVTNSQSGAVTNINSTNIRQTGTDDLNYTGASDVFQILASLRDALQNKNDLPPTQQTTAVSQTLSELDRVNQSVLNTVGQQSASLQNLQAVDQQIQNVQLQTQQQIQNVQGADISQVVIGMQAEQNLLQATLYSTSKILSLSLLDFLK